jgi:uncharacterized protein (UPF0332 family)
MKARFEDCLSRGKIVRIRKDPGLVAKELREADRDLAAAEKSLADGNEKWAIIQGYYAMFHACRALIYSLGYREKSHLCLQHAIEALFVDEGLLPEEILGEFSHGMGLRESADYGSVYDRSSAQDLVLSARKVVSAARGILP